MSATDGAPEYLSAGTLGDSVTNAAAKGLLFAIGTAAFDDASQAWNPDVASFYPGASPFYTQPVHVTGLGWQVIEHGKHIAELGASFALTIIPVAVGYRLGRHASEEFGRGHRGRALVLHAGSVACFAAAGAWFGGHQAIMNSPDLLHDPKAVPAVITAIGFAAVGGTINAYRQRAAITAHTQK